MKYFNKINGIKCYLSPINLDDVALYTKWLNDPEIIEYLTLRNKVVSLHSEKEILEKMSYKHNYGIVVKEDNKLIGNCGFLELDHINRNCEVGIFIGDKEYLGKGYGTEALKLLISYGINYLNLNNFMLRVFSSNERAIKSYNKIGFKNIGIRRKAIIAHKEKYDMVYMDLLSEEFVK